VLVAEDDEGLGEVLARGLREQGYVVDLVPDGETAAAYLRFYSYEVAVLDWRMPRLSGLDLVRRLRRGGTATPVLILTARDAPADRITGLDAGADDYLVKPFNLDELLARIRALLRRTQTERMQVYKFADLTMDTGSRQVTRAGRLIPVTAKEYELLELFLRHPRQVLTRDVIFDRIWSYDFGGESNIIEVYVRYLRQKTEAEGEQRLIQTVRGVGYALRED
jgi:two-component system response regulator MprA